MMGLQLVTGAAASPVSVAEAKGYIGIETAEWDAMLGGFIAAATGHAEAFLGKAVGEQSWLLALDGFADVVELAKGPVTEVGDITYLDADRVEQTLDPGVYIHDLISVPQRLVRDPEESFPAVASGVPNAVKVAFTTGYPAANGPAQIKQAILLAVASMFRDRENGGFPKAAEALLQPLRRIVI